MNESADNAETSSEPRGGSDAPIAPFLNDSMSPMSADEEVPQFGAVDIVEAFTAMRHEWRGQTKESRALAEQIQAAVTTLQTLEAKLGDRAADRTREESSAARQLVELITETDHQLSRAITAIAQGEANRRLQETTDTKAVEQYFAGMSAVARWFARPLMKFMIELRSTEVQTATNPALEGLNLVLTRLHRAMKEQGIERIDTEGKEFDANIMNAIGTVAASGFPAGHVAEQLSPAYRWQGRLLRFADVRVAQ